MALQSDIDKAYLRMCVEWARLSTARRRKVGCLIVKNGQIISDGYNGTPKGFDNNCEEEVNGELVTKTIVLHAESNAISKLAKSNNSSDGATLYVTCSFDLSNEGMLLGIFILNIIINIPIIIIRIINDRIYKVFDVLKTDNIL